MLDKNFGITGGGENLTYAQAYTLARIDADRTQTVQHIIHPSGGREAVYPRKR